MFRLILKRLLLLIPVLIGVTFLVFSIHHPILPRFCDAGEERHAGG